jgi:hypothetical protein
MLELGKCCQSLLEKLGMESRLSKLYPNKKKHLEP